MKNFAIAAAVAGLAFTTTPAFAGHSDVPSKTVSTAGIDLGTVEGQKMLERRIDRAARQVCGLNGMPTAERIPSASRRACYAKALSSAKQQVAQMTADQQLGG